MNNQITYIRFTFFDVIFNRFHNFKFYVFALKTIQSLLMNNIKWKPMYTMILFKFEPQYYDFLFMYFKGENQIKQKYKRKK